MPRALLLLAIASAGCDLALLPETADYVDRPTAVAEVAIGSMEASPPEGVDHVEIEIVDVLLHRPSDDAWLLLGSESAVVDLMQPAMKVPFREVPLGLEHYDAITVVVGDVNLGSAGTRRDVVTVTDEIEIQGHWTIDRDVRIELRFDMAESLWRTKNQWQFAPSIHASVQPTPSQ